MRSLRPSVFRRYLVSYLALFLVPFAALSALLYTTTVRRLRDQIELAGAASLAQAAAALERRFDDIDSVAARITIDPRLTPYWVKSPGYARIDAVRELASYASRGGFVDEIVMLLEDSPAVLLSSGVVSRDSFFGAVYRYGGKSQAEMQALVAAARRPTLLPTHTVSARASDAAGGRFLTYVYPIPPRDPHPYGALLFLIAEERIIELGAGPIFAVLDASGTVVASSAPGASGLEALSRAAAGARPGRLFGATIEGRPHAAMSAASQALDLVVLSAAPRRELLRGVTQARAIVVVAIALMGALGTGIAYVLSRRSYEPVRRLADLAAGSAEARADGSGGVASERDDEFELIRKAFEGASESRRDLLLTIEAQKPLVRERFLSRLISGDAPVDAELARVAREAGVELPFESFFAVVVRLPRGGQRPVWDGELALHLLREFSTPELRSYGMELPGEGEVAIVVNAAAPPADSRALRERVAAEIRRLLEARGGVGASIGVGRSYAGARSVAVSFLEASGALGEPTSAGGVSVAFFDDLSSASVERTWYPLEEELLLAQAIKQGNDRLGIQTIERIAARIRSEARSVFVSRIICFDLLNTVVKTVKELRADGFERDVDAAVRFATLEELTRNLSRLVEVVCEHVRAARGTRHERLREAILAYVRDNFHTRTFCLEELATRFDLSLSHLSRFFKEQTGSRFSEYVNALRMEDVKSKLRDTELPVTEIVRSIGYGDAANFIRKFRKLEGVTPGAYRELHRASRAPTPPRPAPGGPRFPRRSSAPRRRG